MKATDDYKAKIRLWVENLTVVPAGPPPKLPPFKSKKFNSYEEMNAWKKELIRQMARSAQEELK